MFSARCAVGRDISMGSERSSSLGPEQATQMLCVSTTSVECQLCLDELIL